jgi:hypothetical protein
MAKRNWAAGNVVQIPLENGGCGYGVVVREPLVALFNFQSEVEPPLESIMTKPIAFKVWVHRPAIGKKGWKVIGNVSLPRDLLAEPAFYRFDVISKRFSIYHAGKERPATKEECLPLECAAVWEKEHVESRLNDFFAGRKNKWVDSLSASNRAT